MDAAAIGIWNVWVGGWNIISHAFLTLTRGHIKTGKYSRWMGP